MCSIFHNIFKFLRVQWHPVELLYPANTLSAKCLICYNFQGASKLLKVGENSFQVSNSLDLDETPSY